MSCSVCDIYEEKPGRLVHACRCRGGQVVLIHKKCAQKYYSSIDGNCESCNTYCHELFDDDFDPISLGADSTKKEYNVIENIIQFVKSRQKSVFGIATLVLLSIVLLFVAFFQTLLLLYFVAYGSTEKDEWDDKWSTFSVINYVLLSFALLALPHQPRLLNIMNRTPNRRHFIIKLSLFAIVYDLICVVIFTMSSISDTFFIIPMFFLLIQAMSTIRLRYRFKTAGQTKKLTTFIKDIDD